MNPIKPISTVLLGLTCATFAWADGPEVPPASCASGEASAAGRSYGVQLTSWDGQTIDFQVLEPAAIDCDRPGQHPLMLHGPGFSGTKSTSGFENYREAGYTVISWSPRGFGGTTGSVRVMDPEFEGRYYVQILDWAEQNLDYLAWRNEAATARPFVPRPQDATSSAKGANLVVGAIGGSYGGGYQLMLLTMDGKKRLDAIHPDITWHDLRNSLNPGDTPKSQWDLVLSAAGTGVGYASGDSVEGMDPYIEETLAKGSTLNEFPRQALDWFHYRGLGYWCQANGYPSMPVYGYGTDNIPMVNAHGNEKAPGDSGLGPVLLAAGAEDFFGKLDVLFTQGMPDTLFNYNEMWWNAQCLSAAGADVSIFTHNGGHVLPYVQSPDKFTLDSGSCPVQELDWFDARLKQGAPEHELEATACFALGGGNDDVVYLDKADILAPGSANGNFVQRAVEGPAGAAVSLTSIYSYAQVNGMTSVPVPLGNVDGGAILAGIPHLRLTVASLHGLNEAGREQLAGAIGADDSCTQNSLPLRAGCDSIIFVGLAKRTGDAPNYALIDDQVKPVRGLGSFELDLVGVAERLNDGDELALVVFGSHPQFFAGPTRDPSLPAVSLQGSIDLPLYAVDSEGKPVVNGNADDRLN